MALQPIPKEKWFIINVDTGQRISPKTYLSEAAAVGDIPNMLQEGRVTTKGQTPKLAARQLLEG